MTCCRHWLTSSVRVGRIRSEGQRGAGPIRNLPETLGIAIQQRKAGAIPGEAERSAATDARGGAGHDAEPVPEAPGPSPPPGGLAPYRSARRRETASRPISPMANRPTLIGSGTEVLGSTIKFSASCVAGM